MRDIIFTLVLIAATVGMIYLIRLLTANFRDVCKRPEGELRIYFDDSCECLEYYLERAFRSSELRDIDLRVTVVDRVGTHESRQWLEALRTKLKWNFEIITEEENQWPNSKKP